MTKRKSFAEFIGDKNSERFTCPYFITVKEGEQEQKSKEQEPKDETDNKTDNKNP